MHGYIPLFNLYKILPGGGHPRTTPPRHVVLICCCIPNFIKIGSRVRPPDAHNCWMYNAPLLARQRPLPWQPHHGGHVGGMMRCDHPSCIPVGPLVGEIWHFLNIFQHGGRPPFWILKILIFDLMTVIAVLTCSCIPNFIKILHSFGLQTPMTAECSMRRC